MGTDHVLEMKSIIYTTIHRILKVLFFLINSSK